ncbi:hypothetical protein [Chitinophaga agri]|uniref:Uncharacterized protein n=1 Tax=Chitinophaga agri TaxID=2703787 RepID=A0A6B9ZKQ9_9BACT|nr:hypothetical protein [Chitinophaga agri]QHS62171.1 hypothetical protein GWR21_21940 [Chitinophaga agri]
MKFTCTLLVLFACLLTVSGGCSKDNIEEKTIIQKGLIGKIVYSSCAATVVQVMNKDIGVTWTNCHDRQVYENVLSVAIINRAGIAIGEEFHFNIIEKEPQIVCDMLDCGPIAKETILITGR